MTNPLLRALVTALVVMLVSCGGGPADEAPGDTQVMVPTKEELEKKGRDTAALEGRDTGQLLELVKAKAAELDPSAEIRELKYSWGDRNLQFRNLGAIFWTPDNEANDISIQVRGKGNIRIRRVGFGNPADIAGINLQPQKAVQAALAKGLAAQWDRLPTASLFAYLLPMEYNRYLKVSRDCTWLWRLLLSGPGVTEDYEIYVDAQSFQILGEKRETVKTP
jgi:hypothetical protein